MSCCKVYQQSTVMQSSRPAAYLEVHVDGAQLPAVLLERVVLDAVDPHLWTALAKIYF